MLIDLSNAVGAYLHEVFIQKFQWWVVLGYVAQIMFTMRFLVQWIASERAGKMVMPIAFWFFSIGGGLLLFGYALYKRDPVFISLRHQKANSRIRINRKLTDVRNFDLCFR